MQVGLPLHEGRHPTELEEEWEAEVVVDLPLLGVDRLLEDGDMKGHLHHHLAERIRCNLFSCILLLIYTSSTISITVKSIIVKQLFLYPYLLMWRNVL